MTAFLFFVIIVTACAVYGFIEDGPYGALLWGAGVGASVAHFVMLYYFFIGG